jgi:hypothetical protein
MKAMAFCPGLIATLVAQETSVYVLKYKTFKINLRVSNLWKVLKHITMEFDVNLKS